jgi:hypothetical protein
MGTILYTTDPNATMGFREATFEELIAGARHALDRDSIKAGCAQCAHEVVVSMRVASGRPDLVVRGSRTFPARTVVLSAALQNGWSNRRPN